MAITTIRWVMPGPAENRCLRELLVAYVLLMLLTGGAGRPPEAGGRHFASPLLARQTRGEAERLPSLRGDEARLTSNRDRRRPTPGGTSIVNVGRGAYVKTESCWTLSLWAIRRRSQLSQLRLPAQLRARSVRNTSRRRSLKRWPRKARLNRHRHKHPKEAAIAEVEVRYVHCCRARFTCCTDLTPTRLASQVRVQKWSPEDPHRCSKPLTQLLREPPMSSRWCPRRRTRR